MTNDLALSRNILDPAGRLSAGSAGPSLWQRITAWLAEQRRFNRTLRELERMDDRELQDIGISRHDLRQIARDAACANTSHTG